MSPSRFADLYEFFLHQRQHSLPHRARVQERTAARGAPLELSRRQALEAAVRWFHEGRYARSLDALSPAQDRAPADPRAAAVRAAVRALGTGRVRRGIEEVAEILETALYAPDIYCALALLLQKAKRRREAYVVLRAGLRVCPNHPALHHHLREMGIRRPPVLGFLPRGHPANRLLGRLRYRLRPHPA
ncbi:MAG: hypothetical protein Kow0092_02570 [Deferrisomatales bacterium]